ncbi:MAG: OmpA family protein [Proteobacteria bacterium]|nr:OmpA family protein [Pseudomonadota bacterium]
MRLTGVWLAACAATISVALLPAQGRAQPFQGFYVGGSAGYDLPNGVRVTTPQPASPRTVLEGNGGYAALGSVGYGLGNGYRFELEGNFRQYGVNKFASGVASSAGGNVQTYGAMANVLFDMDIGFPWLYPYVGGGVGYAWTHLNKVTAVAPGGFSLNADDTQSGFAFQAIAGLSFPMPGIPGLSATTEYRFLGIPGGETFSATQSGTPSQLQLNRQFSNSFLVGVRYAFGVQPPPAPAPAKAAPAPAPARTYQVFFDWDKATLSDRARQIIREAADAVPQAQTTRIEVNGYTDTSGSPKYNMALSLRRAQAVAAELVKDGVAKNLIAIQGFGQTHLLVPTADGVREPQNRRVEIILK